MSVVVRESTGGAGAAAEREARVSEGALLCSGIDAIGRTRAPGPLQAGADGPAGAQVGDGAEAIRRGVLSVLCLAAPSVRLGMTPSKQGGA